MIALLCATAAEASGWTKDLGELYVKAGGDLYYSDHYDAPSAGLADYAGGTYFGQQYALYGEVGLLEAWKVQLTVFAPLVFVGARTIEDPSGEYSTRATTTRSGDFRGALQVALHRELPLALSVDVKVPAYRIDTIGGEYQTQAEIFPSPGEGQIDLGAMVFAGASPGPGNFVEGGLGFVHRTEVFLGFDTDSKVTDGARFLAKGGHRFGPFLPVLGIEGVLSPDASALTKSNVDLFATALVDVAKGLAIEPRFSYDLYARSTSKGFGGGLGLSYRR